MGRKRDIAVRMLELQHERDALIAYCGAKLRAEDFHAVCDAAVDLREIDTEIQTLHERGVHRANDRIRQRDKREAVIAHGITPQKHAEMAAYQAGCAICGAAGGFNGRRLAIDHSHRSGRVRGLLCDGCNMGLGAFRDDERIVRLAAKYLRGNWDQ